MEVYVMTFEYWIEKRYISVNHFLVVQSDFSTRIFDLVMTG